MTTITDTSAIERCRDLLTAMMLSDDQCEFSSDWILSHGWKVVPKESMARISRADIPRLVAVLTRAGYEFCLAIATEPLGDMPTCYKLAMKEGDLLELNRRLGAFRFILTDENRTWAISCNESYNLFAGKPELVEALLGESITVAEQKFLQFASLLAHGNATDPLLEIARRYAR